MTPSFSHGIYANCTTNKRCFRVGAITHNRRIGGVATALVAGSRMGRNQQYRPRSMVGTINSVLISSIRLTALRWRCDVFELRHDNVHGVGSTDLDTCHRVTGVTQCSVHILYFTAYLSTYNIWLCTVLYLCLV